MRFPFAPRYAHAPRDPRRVAIARMADNALGPLSGATLLRVTVTFHDPSKVSVDEALGRAIHVTFLEHVPFLRLLTQRYAHFFRSDYE